MWFGRRREGKGESHRLEMADGLVPVPGKAFQRQEPGVAGTVGDGPGTTEDHHFLLVTSLITCTELRNYLPPPTLERLKPLKGQHQRLRAI